MRILVPVKQVAFLDEDFELREDGLDVDPHYLEHDLNEWDRFSLEAGLQLRDGAGAGEVVVISVGGDEAHDALLACLAQGADRGVRIDPGDDAAPDSIAVARLLATYTEREAFDLILCGVQSSDAMSGATGVALAAFAGVPHVAVVRSIAFDADTSSLTVDRELEGGLVERLRVRSPVLLTVQTGANEPRYANLRAIKMAESKPMDVLALHDLGFDAPALKAATGSQVVAMHAPVRTRQPELLQGDAAAIASRIADIIKHDGTAV
jgi:electron transfer flavoprotein beta subunit